MKNNKNLAKPVIAVALAASFFASPLNTVQVEAFWSKAQQSEDQSDYTSAKYGFMGSTYMRETEDTATKVKVSRLVKCKKKNYLTQYTKKYGLLRCTDGVRIKDIIAESHPGKDYTIEVKKNYYANKITVKYRREDPSWLFFYGEGYFQRKSKSAKSATWSVVGDYSEGNGKSMTFCIKGKINKDGEITITSNSGQLNKTAMKKLKSLVREAWLNRVDHPVTNPANNTSVDDENAVRIK